MNSVSLAHINLFAVARLTAACIGFVLAGGATGGDYDAALQALDRLVERQEYTRAVIGIRRIEMDTERRIAWLRRHAETGHPPLQNELAIELLDRDLVASLKWFARGRLARILDAAECRAAGVSKFPDPPLERVRIAAVANPDLLLKASDEAIEWATGTFKRPSSRWICGSREPLETEAKRAGALGDMRLASKRLRNYVDSVEAGKKHPTRVHEFEAVATVWNDRSAWLDNERLLFIAVEPPNAKPYVYLWEVGERAPIKLFPDLQANAVCVHDGRITLLTYSTTGPTEAFEGTLERVTRVSEVSSSSNDRLVACRQRTFARVYDGTLIRPLPRGHGQLQSKRGPGVTEFVRSDGRSIQLPISSYGGRLLDYATWSGAYLLSGPGVSSESIGPLVSRYGSGADVELFSLWPDGRTERHLVPYGIWDTQSSQSQVYRLSRPGLIISGGDQSDEEVDGWNGVFLFPFGRRDAVRLIEGRHTIGDISPDGCRLALGWSLTKRKPKNFVRVIDVCGG